MSILNLKVGQIKEANMREQFEDLDGLTINELANRLQYIQDNLKKDKKPTIETAYIDALHALLLNDANKDLAPMIQKLIADLTQIHNKQKYSQSILQEGVKLKRVEQSKATTTKESNKPVSLGDLLKDAMTGVTPLSKQRQDEDDEVNDFVWEAFETELEQLQAWKMRDIKDYAAYTSTLSALLEFKDSPTVVEVLKQNKVKIEDWFNCANKMYQEQLEQPISKIQASLRKNLSNEDKKQLLHDFKALPRLPPFPTLQTISIPEEKANHDVEKDKAKLDIQKSLLEAKKIKQAKEGYVSDEEEDQDKLRSEISRLIVLLRNTDETPTVIGNLSKCFKRYTTTLNDESDFDADSEADQFEQEYKAFLKKIVGLDPSQFSSAIDEFLDKIKDVLQLPKDIPLQRENTIVGKFANINALFDPDKRAVSMQKKPDLMSESTEEMGEPDTSTVEDVSENSSVSGEQERSIHSDAEGHIVEDVYDEDFTPEGLALWAEGLGEQAVVIQESFEKGAELPINPSTPYHIDTDTTDELTPSELLRNRSIPIAETSQEFYVALFNELKNATDPSEIMPILWRHHEALGLKKHEVAPLFWSKVFTTQSSMADIFKQVSEVIIDHHPELADILPQYTIDVTRYQHASQWVQKQIQSMRMQAERDEGLIARIHEHWGKDVSNVLLNQYLTLLKERTEKLKNRTERYEQALNVTLTDLNQSQIDSKTTTLLQLEEFKAEPVIDLELFGQFDEVKIETEQKLKSLDAAIEILERQQQQMKEEFESHSKDEMARKLYSVHFIALGQKIQSLTFEKNKFGKMFLSILSEEKPLMQAQTLQRWISQCNVVSQQLNELQTTYDIPYGLFNKVHDLAQTRDGVILNINDLVEKVELVARQIEDIIEMSKQYDIQSLRHGLCQKDKSWLEKKHAQLMEGLPPIADELRRINERDNLLIPNEEHEVEALIQQYKRLLTQVNALKKEADFEPKLSMKADIPSDAFQLFDEARINAHAQLHVFKEQTNNLDKQYQALLLKRNNHKEHPLRHALYDQEAAAFLAFKEERAGLLAMLEEKLATINARVDQIKQYNYPQNINKETISELTCSYNDVIGAIKNISPYQQLIDETVLDEFEQQKQRASDSRLQMQTTAENLEQTLAQLNKKNQDSKTLGQVFYTNALSNVRTTLQGALQTVSEIENQFAAVDNEFPKQVDENLLSHLPRFTERYARLHLQMQDINARMKNALNLANLYNQPLSLSGLEHAFDKVTEVITTVSQKINALSVTEQEIYANLPSDVSMAQTVYVLEMNKIRSLLQVANESFATIRNEYDKALATIPATEDDVQSLISKYDGLLMALNQLQLDYVFDKNALAQVQALDDSKAAADQLYITIGDKLRKLSAYRQQVLEKCKAHVTSHIGYSLYHKEEQYVLQQINQLSNKLQPYAEKLAQYGQKYKILQSGADFENANMQALARQYDEIGTELTTLNDDLDKPQAITHTPIEERIVNTQQAIHRSTQLYDQLGDAEELKRNADAARDAVRDLMNRIAAQDKVLHILVKDIHGVNTNKGLSYYFIPGKDEVVLKMVHQDLEENVNLFLEGKGPDPTPFMTALRQNMLAKNPSYMGLSEAKKQNKKVPHLDEQIKALEDSYDEYIQNKITMLKLEHELRQCQRQVAYYEVFSVEKARAHHQIIGANKSLDALLALDEKKADPLQVNKQCEEIEQWCRICETACATAKQAEMGQLKPKTILSVIRDVHMATTPFEHTLVREGEHREPKAANTNHLNTISGEQLVQFQGVSLEKKDYIESSRMIISSQDNKTIVGKVLIKHFGDGHVVDETDRSKPIASSHTKDWARANEEAAIEQAFQLLLNYEPGQKITLKPPHANKEQAKRLYAAILHLSAASGMGLKQSDIQVFVIGVERPVSTALFIRKHLPSSVGFVNNDSEQLREFTLALKTLTKKVRQADETGQLKSFEPKDAGEIAPIKPKV